MVISEILLYTWCCRDLGCGNQNLAEIQNKKKQNKTQNKQVRNKQTIKQTKRVKSHSSVFQTPKPTWKEKHPQGNHPAKSHYLGFIL